MSEPYEDYSTDSDEKTIDHFFSHRSFGRVAYGLDIGGTLTKLVYFEPKKCVYEQEYMEKINNFIEEQSKLDKSGIDKNYSIYIESLDGYLHFIKFQSVLFQKCLDLVKSNGLTEQNMIISGTGGGAYKYEHLIQKELECDFYKEDELECLVRGMAFIQENYTKECYTYLPTSIDSGEIHCIKKTVEMKKSPYPFLLVNIGSGVSILKVESEHVCERVGGSGIGGATFLGLSKLLTKATTFEEAIELASTGNSSNVDMLVKDIYGGDYEKFNLKGNTVASNFGCMVKDIERGSSPSDNDLCRGLLNMITNNLCSIAFLHAKRLNIERIIFSGNFLHKNQPAMYLITNSLRYWSAGMIKALFLEHEGYCGAVGALLCRIDKYIDQYLDHIVDEYERFSDLDRSLLRRRASIEHNITLSRDKFSVIPNITADEDDVHSVDMDTHATTIKVTSYEWKDTPETITVSVHLPGLSDSMITPKIHLWGGQRFISLLVHIPENYIYTLRLSVLYSSIDASSLQYEININTNEISLYALKKDIGMWPRLELLIERKEERSQSMG